MREKSVFIKATLAKMKVFKGKFSKNKEGQMYTPAILFFCGGGGGGGGKCLPCHQVSVGELS